ncbi:hypothetical protein SJAG_02409 [Schizosaccharomyces japonicus yFS275]|uniref:Stc1 domain-containing protein n=1 Tax=Schizosaccharomyces japonicus (strain yFS275 / FY16936) TaxID=402676 RepID=B6K2E2_SCHJY|nr:hypothetical protein SJAG_02409 [Schizosaccharomyces japonicus yFS275]EEB07323.1 hypothetical protein SJAG_02409 [Schizosaccharomyces japonicus yFS275]
MSTFKKKGPKGVSSVRLVPRGTSKSSNMNHTNFLLQCSVCRKKKPRSSFNSNQWEKAFRYERGNRIFLPDALALCTGCSAKNSEILQCTRCEKYKQLDEFSKSQRRTFEPRCKVCVEESTEDNNVDFDNEFVVGTDFLNGGDSDDDDEESYFRDQQRSAKKPVAKKTTVPTVKPALQKQKQQQQQQQQQVPRADAARNTIKSSATTRVQTPIEEEEDDDVIEDTQGVEDDFDEDFDEDEDDFGDDLADTFQRYSANKNT